MSTATTATPRERLRADPARVLRTYLVTDTAQCGDRGVLAVVREAVAGGAGVVQVREKGSDAVRGELVRAVVAAVGERALVLVDDDVELAVAAGAAGAHVGQGDGDPRRARGLLGPGAVLGLSASTAAEVAAAAVVGVEEPGGRPVVDYLGLGPVWATATKPRAAAPLGLDGLADLVVAARDADLPSVAIGGVDLARVAAVRATGVDGICAVSAICRADDPRAATAALDAPATTAVAR